MTFTNDPVLPIHFNTPSISTISLSSTGPLPLGHLAGNNPRPNLAKQYTIITPNATKNTRIFNGTACGPAKDSQSSR